MGLYYINKLWESQWLTLNMFGTRSSLYRDERAFICLEYKSSVMSYTSRATYMLKYLCDIEIDQK